MPISETTLPVAPPDLVATKVTSTVKNSSEVQKVNKFK